MEFGKDELKQSRKKNMLKFGKKFWENLGIAFGNFWKLSNEKQHFWSTKFMT